VNFAEKWRGFFGEKWRSGDIRSERRAHAPIQEAACRK
jgi:hypothetical protein